MLLILRQFLLLLILLKVGLGFASLRGSEAISSDNDTVRFHTVLQVICSISLFFSIYFLLLASAGIKGSLDGLGPFSVLNDIVCFILFVASAVSDLVLVLYTLGPVKFRGLAEIILTVIAGLYGISWITYFAFLVHFHKTVPGKLVKEV